MCCFFDKDLVHAEILSTVFAQLLSNAKKYVFDKLSNSLMTISP